MSDIIHPTHTLFLQLQARYPGATLVAELVQIHQESYVVRCLVQLHGTTLATAMSAAPEIEQAEDQSRSRVFALLGIGAQVAARPTSPALSSYDQGIPLPTGSSDRSYELPVAPTPFVPDAAIPTPTSGNGTLRSSPIPPLPLTADLSEKPSVPDPSTSEAKPIPAVVDKPLPKQKKNMEEPGDLPDSTAIPFTHELSTNFDRDPDLDSFLAPTEKAIGEPVDLSELIALTDVEMERIGWGKKRGQGHLKRTYGKQTRAELNEDQLLEFLHFLRALPSQGGGDDE